MRRRIAILFGGRSAEHEVSVVSARSVMNALDPRRYEVIPIGVTREGRWQLVAGGGGAPAGGPPHAGPADANPGNDGPGRIRCGTTTCTAVQQFCCVRGTRATCEPAVGGNCPTNGDRLYCDDRTDCLANQICCAADLPSTSSLADCRLAAVCNGPKAQHLCDPQLPLSCAGMNGVCRADQDSTIDGYPYCH